MSRKDSRYLFTWSNNNGMKANGDKRHLLLSTKKTLKANISNYTIINSDKEKTVWSNNRQRSKI